MVTKSAGILDVYRAAGDASKDIGRAGTMMVSGNPSAAEGVGTLMQYLGPTLGTLYALKLAKRIGLQNWYKLQGLPPGTVDVPKVVSRALRKK